MPEPSWENCKNCVHNHIRTCGEFERKENYCAISQESIYGYYLIDKTQECMEKEVDNGAKE